MQTSDPTAWLGRTVGGRYRLLSVLGRGAAGQVFRSSQEPLGREVAVKLLHPELLGSSRDEYQARFLREAALAGRISHPNVVTVHDYGVEPDGTSFVVMELLHGRLLADVVRGNLALDPRRAASIVVQLARGLRAAHAHGVVHRDVKPHNVMVVAEDGVERAVLIDFGLVKVQDADQPTDADSAGYETRRGAYMGTPAYMAPEQARGDPLDHRADLYALGVLAYRLFTGAVPFWADNPLGLAVQHLTEPLPRMEVRAPGCDVPAELERITTRLLAKHPDDRYPDATALVRDLDAWLLGGARPSAPGPTRKGGGVVVGAAIGMMGLSVAAVCAAALIGVVWWARPNGAPPPPTPPLVVPVTPAVTLRTPPADPVQPAHPDPAPPRPAPADPPAPAAPPPAPVAPPPTPVAPPRTRPVPRPDVDRPPPLPVPIGAPLPLPMPGQVVAGAVVVDGVPFSTAAAERALAFVNTASEADLRRAGVYDRGVGIILSNRPFSSLEALGATYGIGPGTVKRIAASAR